MQDSKLILLLKTFNKEDWRWFRKFLLSPYFNNRKELINLFDYLRSQSPDFPLASLKKEKVFKKVFPKEAFNEKQLSYSMSYLLTQAEQFLTQRKFEESQPRINNFLLSALVDRNLNKNYNFHYDKFSKQLDRYETQNIDYFLLKYQFTEIANMQFLKQNLRQEDNHLFETYNNLHQFYFLNILKHSCELLTRQKSYGNSYNFQITDNTIAIIKNQKDIPPIVSIYLQIYSLLKEKNEEEIETNFQYFKGLLATFYPVLPLVEKRIIYLHAINFCILQAHKNRNTQFYLEEMLEFYLFGINNEFLLSKGFLTPWTFKNVIKIGLNLKRYDFTESFIKEYHQKLEQEFQEDALHFNLADLNYRKKNYQEAQIHLLKIEYADIFYAVGSKAMLLKIYYETDEIEALLALIASFSIYLRRNKKIAKNTKESYLNFTIILGQVIRATKDKIPKVITKINDTPHLFNKAWLLEICSQKK